jgi:ribosomal protein S27AE
MMIEITVDDFQCPQCEADMETVYKEDKFHCGTCGNIYVLERSDNNDYESELNKTIEMILRTPLDSSTKVKVLSEKIQLLNATHFS